MTHKLMKAIKHYQPSSSILFVWKITIMAAISLIRFISFLLLSFFIVIVNIAPLPQQLKLTYEPGWRFMEVCAFVPPKAKRCFFVIFKKTMTIVGIKLRTWLTYIHLSDNANLLYPMVWHIFILFQNVCIQLFYDTTATDLFSSISICLLK